MFPTRALRFLQAYVSPSTRSALPSSNSRWCLVSSVKDSSTTPMAAATSSSAFRNSDERVRMDERIIIT